VPQLPSYMTAPTALFQASMLNVMNLHHCLDAMHVEDDACPSFFMRAYGGNYTYHSNRSLQQYGYDADIHYKALQAGATLLNFEAENSALSLGLAGTYGNLSFKPRDVDGIHSTKMKLWTASPYMTWQHQSGFYVDVIVSYGHFNGSVSTNSRGRTASLSGHSYAASMQAGIPIALGSDGLTFEPQAQLLYQRLEFDKTQDIDGITVDIGKPDQWLLRVGGRLEKHLHHAERGSDIKLYGKLNLIHALSDENRLWLGDTFHTGRFGSHLEAGIGIKASLSQKANLYGDITWDKNLSKSGSHGFTFSAGLKVSF